VATETMARPRMHAHQARRQQRRQTHDGAAFRLMTPFLVFYVLFLIGPTVYGAVMSLFNTSLVRPGLGEFVGLNNYAQAFASSEFWSSLWHTVLFTIMTTPPLVALALLFALLAERVARGRWFFRLVFFAPYVIPSSVIALIWVWLYTPDIGLYASWLSSIGITPPAWLEDPNWAMASVAIATIWWTVGFNFVLYLAGLQEIPRELYEAAAIDGSGPWQQITRITVPMLGRTTTLVAVLQVIASLKIFDQIYLMTQGGPEFATRPAIQYIYDTGFTDFRVGYASAVSMLLFFVILLVSFGWFSIVRRQEKGV
jgi:multiple sugar transport system permease protein